MGKATEVVALRRGKQQVISAAVAKVSMSDKDKDCVIAQMELLGKGEFKPGSGKIPDKLAACKACLQKTGCSFRAGWTSDHFHCKGHRMVHKLGISEEVLEEGECTLLYGPDLCRGLIAEDCKAARACVGGEVSLCKPKYSTILKGQDFRAYAIAANFPRENGHPHCGVRDNEYVCESDPYIGRCTWQEEYDRCIT